VLLICIALVITCTTYKIKNPHRNGEGKQSGMSVGIEYVAA